MVAMSSLATEAVYGGVDAGSASLGWGNGSREGKVERKKL